MRFCVKVVVMFCTLLIGWALYGASATWTGIYTGDFPSEMTEGTMESELRGRVSGSDGVGASIIGMFYIHEESATMRLKVYDYSETVGRMRREFLHTLAPTGNYQIQVRDLSSYNNLQRQGK